MSYQVFLFTINTQTANSVANLGAIGIDESIGLVSAARVCLQLLHQGDTQSTGANNEHIDLIGHIPIIAGIAIETQTLVNKARCQRRHQGRADDGNGCRCHQVAGAKKRAIDSQIEHTAHKIGQDEVEVVTHIGIAPNLHIKAAEQA